ncbi:HD domain-containing phosphohydrolase [Phosphitispora fastidiosa]|uniref:HD domain-containing phosphohydrolase n=1 Tax=Phosphitispora fastidiosa TaxID=2837202 RepID=UPI001E55A617|nr:HD domain-containing phosphohydrolase [Phosphitispora fastidiosa]MBU7007957.1 HD-GYP domain-containing protein (c-di-GMP phosphodiesterase class II) [Phosphitispora fastidiosa]
MNKTVSWQTNQIQNLRDAGEISKYLSFPGGNANIKHILCRAALNDLEVDAGMIFIDTGQGFNPEAVLNLPQLTEKMPGSPGCHEVLEDLAFRDKHFVLHTKREINSFIKSPLKEIINGYESALVHFSQRKSIRQAVISLSEAPGYFNKKRIDFSIKAFEKTLFALDRYKNSELILDENIVDEEYSLFAPVCALLSRLFRAEKSIIALLGQQNQYIVKGFFGDSKPLWGTILEAADGHSIKDISGLNYKNMLCVPINCDNSHQGFLSVMNKFDEDFADFMDFDSEDYLLLTLLAGQLGLLVENRSLFRMQRESLETTIHSLVQALDARDPYTKGHSEQVSQLAIMIAKELSLPAEEIEDIRLAGLLHDIGKIGIPEKILNKPDNLTSIEFNQIKVHPYISAQILKPIELFKTLLPFVYHHHERWDGKGYPDGLKGEAIPLGARILAVADAFDAITADRVYRPGKDDNAAVNELVKWAGIQFDPLVVDALLTGLEKKLFQDKVDSEWQFDKLSNVFEDVLDAVTRGRLVISDDWDITRLSNEGKKLGEAVVKEPGDVRMVRQAVKDCLKHRVPDPEINKFLLCISEVATNMVKHASGGMLAWYLCNDGKIRVIAEDSGPGLSLRDLPKATLVRGVKDNKALGLGFTLLMELMNKIYLKTGEHGTTLILEQKLDSSTGSEEVPTANKAI